MASLGIYIHIPFCVQKCGYCHFLSFPFNTEMETRYTNALLGEIRRCSNCNNFGEVDSIFFGGGTPSLIPEENISRILETCRSVFSIAGDCEISLEANPGTLTDKKVSEYRKAGVNRISLGAQSFQDSELAIVGRIHNRAMIYDAVNMLRAQNFSNINLDLILGLPAQTAESWRSNLEQLVSLRTSHISLYMLDLEDSSNPVPEKSWILPDEDAVADLYMEAAHFLNKGGYAQYEISNFAQRGYSCRHNLKYWKREPVLGFGLGSHSFDGNARFSNSPLMEDYCRMIEAGGSPEIWRENIAGEQALQETLFLGLRLSEGIDWRLLKNSDSSEFLPYYENILQEFSAGGLVEWEAMRVRLTEKGRLLSNEIFRMFV